jgi:hypothetical protein
VRVVYAAAAVTVACFAWVAYELVRIYRWADSL